MSKGVSFGRWAQSGQCADKSKKEGAKTRPIKSLLFMVVASVLRNVVHLRLR